MTRFDNVYEGDKKAEEDLDERLLIPFSQCLRWSNNDSSLSRKHCRHYEVVATGVTQVWRNNLILSC